MSISQSSQQCHFHFSLFKNGIFKKFINIDNVSLMGVIMQVVQTKLAAFYARDK